MDVLSSCLDEDTDDETDDGDGMANETGDVCSECVGLAVTEAAEANLSSLLLLSVPAATSVLTTTDTDGADEESPMMSLVLVLLLLLFTVAGSSRGLGALFGDVMLAFLIVFIVFC